MITTQLIPVDPYDLFHSSQTSRSGLLNTTAEMKLRNRTLKWN